MSSSFAELKAKQQAAEKPEPTVAEVVFGGELVKLLVVPLPSTVWRNITAVCSPRPEVAMDRRYGYDLDAATRRALPLSLVEGEDAFTFPVVTGEAEAAKLEHQANVDFFFDSLSGPDLTTASAVIWALNQNNPDVLREKLKKELTAASTVKQPLLENSGLASAASADGSPAPVRRTRTTKKDASPNP